MKIRLGSTPSVVPGSIAQRGGTIPRVVQGRVVKPIIVPPPHLPPVHFFAEAALQGGSEATLNSEALSNRSGRPIEIHEIRLSAWIDAQSAIADYDIAGSLRVRMSMNDKPITNSFVPFWLLGKTEQQHQTYVGGAYADDPTAANAVIYIWRLSRPWYVPPNAKIEVDMQNAGALPDVVHAQIGLAGRYVPELRQTSFLPYAASYVSKSFGYADVDFDESSERDLVNILDREVIIDRIIARVGTLYKINGDTSSHYTDYSSAGPVEDVNIRIFTSTNLPIIRDYSSPRAIFGYSRSMDIRHAIPSKAFYRVGVQKIAAVAAPTPDFDTWQAQAFVSILGSREEVI